MRWLWVILLMGGCQHVGMPDPPEYRYRWGDILVEEFRVLGQEAQWICVRGVWNNSRSEEMTMLTTVACEDIELVDGNNFDLGDGVKGTYRYDDDGFEVAGIVIPRSDTRFADGGCKCQVGEAIGFVFFEENGAYDGTGLFDMSVAQWPALGGTGIRIVI